MKCGACGSTRVYPSRLRNVYERLREALTRRQPHRCHQCGRRTWAEVELPNRDPGHQSPIRPDDLRTGPDTPPVKPNDLDQLDPVRSRR
jgi:hypothetical protein